MKNVTISMDEELHRKIRVDAARHGMSMSRYISEVLKSADAPAREDTEQARRDEQLEALRRLWASPMWDVTDDGRMPDAEQRNARR